jgi:hypothetical protein
MKTGAAVLGILGGAIALIGSATAQKSANA